MSQLKVLIVSSEAAPYVKSGGLGEVVGSLPKELIKHNIDARVVFPKYKTIRESEMENLKYVSSFEIKLGWRNQSASVFTIDTQVPTYLIENDYYFGRDGIYGYGDDFERFAFFSKASIEFLTYVDFKPDVIHLNDWQTGLCSLYLKDYYKPYLFYSNMKTLYTIHNLQYQGVFGKEVLSSIDLNYGYAVGDKLEFYGNISFMKGGLMYADYISTVSEAYAREIQTQEFGYGLDGVLRQRSEDLYGIVNGIDCEHYNPETDRNIYKNYGVDTIEYKAENKTKLQALLGLPVDENIPMMAIISRLVDQKGLDLIAGTIDELMSKNVQLVVLGTGDGRYEHLLRVMQDRFPLKVSTNLLFNDELACRIYSGADIFLMPSLFEPCGLGQIIAMRYGAAPVVRKTGGLVDTVRHYDTNTGLGNGFVFEDYLPSGFMWAVNEALSVYEDKNNWNRIIKNAMSCDFSWDKSAKKYIALYEKLKNCQ